jgi:hypothetical protein
MARALAHLVRAALLVLAGCTIGNGSSTPPAAPAWRPPLDEPTTFDRRILALRSTLGRAGIGLTSRGKQETLSSSTCQLPEAVRNEVGCARCDLISESDPLDDAVLEAIKTAFDRYPTEVLVATGMQNVALCKHIEYEQKRNHVTAGTADIYGHAMLLSVGEFENELYDASGAFTIEDIVHHELYHLLEYERMRDVYMNDPEWRLHNPLGFEYRLRLSEQTARPAGFVNVYAATNEVEDRASVFQYLMTRPDELCEMAKTDSVVRTKAAVVWRRVAALESDRFLRDRATCVDWVNGK